MTKGIDADTQGLSSRYSSFLLQGSMGSITTLPPRGPNVCCNSWFRKHFVDRMFSSSLPVLSTLTQVSARKSATKFGRRCLLWTPFKIWRIRVKHRWWPLKVFPVVCKSLSISSKVTLTILTTSNIFTICLVLPKSSFSIFSWVNILP